MFSEARQSRIKDGEAGERDGKHVGYAEMFGRATTSSWRPRGLPKSVISRVILGVSPVRVLITLLITHLLTPLGLQVSPV